MAENIHAYYVQFEGFTPRPSVFSAPSKSKEARKRKETTATVIPLSAIPSGGRTAQHPGNIFFCAPLPVSVVLLKTTTTTHNALLPFQTIRLNIKTEYKINGSNKVQGKPSW